MITCMIVDDEPHAIEQLAAHVRQTPGLQLVHSSLNPVEALQQLPLLQPALVFLDIQMPQLNGFDFIKAAGPAACHFIMCTAYAQYALEGFNHSVVDYLLKPVTYARFIKAVQKAQALMQPRNQPGRTGYVLLKAAVKHRQLKINLCDIELVEAAGNYTTLHTPGGKHLLRHSMKQLLDELPPAHFIRIHHSFIIPLDNIAWVDANNVQLHSHNQPLPIGASYKAALQQALELRR
jgi:two-component system, LytTR family, response regulator